MTDSDAVLFTLDGCAVAISDNTTSSLSCLALSVSMVISPTIVMSASIGCLASIKHKSGPMPAGSPAVMAIRGVTFFNVNLRC